MKLLWTNTAFAVAEIGIGHPPWRIHIGDYTYKCHFLWSNKKNVAQQLKLNCKWFVKRSGNVSHNRTKTHTEAKNNPTSFSRFLNASIRVVVFDGSSDWERASSASSAAISSCRFCASISSSSMSSSSFSNLFPLGAEPAGEVHVGWRLAVGISWSRASVRLCLLWSLNFNLRLNWELHFA